MSDSDEDSVIEMCCGCGCRENQHPHEDEPINGQQGSEQSSEVVLRVCGGCMQSLYCSRQCQKLQWEDHKQDCVDIGSKLLIGAIAYCDKKTVKRFARHKGYKQYLNNLCQDTTPPWFTCIFEEKLDLLRIILRGGHIDLEKTDVNGLTALALCCMKMHLWTTPALPFVNLLLDAGANINHQLDDGRTALFIAVADVWTRRDASVELVETLLERGADPNIVYSFEGGGARFEYTQLHKTCQLPGEGTCTYFFDTRFAVASALIQAGANVDASCVGGQKTPLFWIACRECVHPSDISMLELLLNAGANVNARDNDGSTALIIAVNFAKRRGSTDIIEALLAGGADPNAIIRDSDTGAEMTPTTKAIHQLYAPAVEAMLGSGLVDFSFGGSSIGTLWDFVNAMLEAREEARSISQAHELDYHEMVRISVIIRSYMNENNIAS